MKEVEVKFHVSSFDDIEKKLKEADFLKYKEFEEEVVYYDSPEGKWKDNKITIRTKTVGDKTVFTIKKNIGGQFKTNFEKECVIEGSLEDFQDMLRMIDLIPDLKYSKKRIHYIKDDCAAELDYIKEIDKRFIELEAQTEEKLRDMVVELGFSDIEADIRSYPNIIREFRGK
jgi:adenylate cyclase class IV